MSYHCSAPIIDPPKCLKNCQRHEYGLYMDYDSIGWVLMEVLTTLEEAKQRYMYYFVRSSCQWKIEKLCVA